MSTDKPTTEKIGEFDVPIDPMDAEWCESCQ